MSVIIRDAHTVEALAQAVGAEIELRGPDGQLLGRFTPAPRPGMMFPEFGRSDEEIDQILNDPNTRWVSGEEVEARLRSLKGDSNV